MIRTLYSAIENNLNEEDKTKLSDAVKYLNFLLII